MTTVSKILIALVIVAASVAGFWFVFSQDRDTLHGPLDERRRISAAGKTTLPADVLTNPASAASYRAPAERSLDMQLYDKALLYLMDVQKPDGHFDSAETGAAPEFQNLNNDILITALSACVLMSSSSGINQNKEALACARKARDWLKTKIKPDGIIADADGPGEAVLAQFFASYALQIAASFSTREELRAMTNKLNSVALLKMKAKNGGYGPPADSLEPRADVLGLAAFVFKFAGYDGFKFDAFQPKSAAGEKNTSAKGAFPIEDEILGNLREGFKRLDSKADKSGAVFAEKAGGPPDWRATVSGMEAMFLINPSRSTVTPALEFVFGPFDKTTETYPRILEHMSWGKDGEAYDAMTLWQGSIAVIYMFTEDKYESKTWVGNLRTMLQSHQSADGGWPVAGEDAKRGRIWRTALHAMTLNLTAPPPPPPAPPPDDQTVNTPAVPPVKK